MTLSNTKRVITHVGNGVATEFPYDFLIPTADDIVVRVLDTTTGVVTTVDPADFSVDGLGEDAGGEVTYPLAGAPLAATDEISILREVAYTQDTDIDNQGGFFPDVLMDQLDRIVMQTQQLAEQMDRTVKLSEFDEVGDLDALTSAVQALVLIESEILAVQAIASEISAVEGNSANINTVAGLETAINTVAGIQAEISTVAGLDTEITALAAISADIQTVADNVVDLANFADVYVGPSATDPATRSDGSALQEGDLYFNTSLNRTKVYNGTVWQLTTANAADVAYDNSASGLDATDAQGALDELSDAAGINYDNAISGLTAADVQAAIDELAGFAGAGLVPIGTVEAAGESALTITGLTGFDQYLLIGTDLRPSTAAIPRLRVGNGAIDSGATDYKYHTPQLRDTSASYAAAVSAGSPQILFGGNINAGAGGSINFVFVLSNRDTDKRPMVHGTFAGLENAASLICGAAMGYRDAQKNVDRVQFSFTSGNVPSGRFTVLGVRHD